MRTIALGLALLLSGCVYESTSPSSTTPTTVAVTTMTLSVDPSVVTASSPNYAPPGVAVVRANVTVGGLPIADGTRIVFGTTAGFVEPGESRTINGVATTLFRTSSTIGVVEIFAYEPEGFVAWCTVTVK